MQAGQRQIYIVERIINMSDLEKDYDKIINQMNEKIIEAAKLIQDVNKFTKDLGLFVLNPSYYERNKCFDYDLKRNLSKEELQNKRDILENLSFKPLFDEITTAGWSASNLDCDWGS